MIKNSTLYRLFPIFVIGMVLATIFDYQITSYLYKPDASWTFVLEVFGEVPALVFTGFNFSLALVYAFRNKKYPFIPLYILGGLISFIYPISRSIKYYVNSWHFEIGAPCGIILFAICLFILFRVNDEFIKTNYKTAVVLVLCALTTLIVVAGLKQVFGRVRFRQLLSDPSLKFTDWYVINGFKDTSHVSFPSGHTSDLCLMLPICLYFKKHSDIAKKITSFAIILIASSRLVAGAHFLSDILCGAFITISICEIYIRKTHVNLPNLE